VFQGHRRCVQRDAVRARRRKERWGRGSERGVGVGLELEIRAVHAVDRVDIGGDAWQSPTGGSNEQHGGVRLEEGRFIAGVERRLSYGGQEKRGIERGYAGAELSGASTRYRLDSRIIIEAEAVEWLEDRLPVTAYGEGEVAGIQQRCVRKSAEDQRTDIESG